jgi:hypothetical protein
MNGGRELALIQGQHYEERHVKEFVHSIWLAKVKEWLVRKWYKKETRGVSTKLTSLIVLGKYNVVHRPQGEDTSDILIRN